MLDNYCTRANGHPKTYFCENVKVTNHYSLMSPGIFFHGMGTAGLLVYPSLLVVSDTRLFRLLVP